MDRNRQKAWLIFQEAFPWITAALAVLSSNWAASALLETFELWAEGEMGVLSAPKAIEFCVFMGMVYLFYRQRGAFFCPHTRLLSNEPAGQRKHLVLFLSSLTKDIEDSGGIPKGLELSFGDINQDISTMEQAKSRGLRWSWEMPLRAIRHHLGILETVTLICSRESIQQSGLFLSICQKYYRLKGIDFLLLVEKGRHSQLAPVCGRLDSVNGWDFESFDDLSRVLWKLLEEFKRRSYLDQEIMIDFTGGQKVTSVVAATMTFNRNIKAQYVQTNSPWSVLSYDVVLASAETGRLGI